MALYLVLIPLDVFAVQVGGLAHARAGFDPILRRDHRDLGNALP